MSKDSKPKTYLSSYNNSAIVREAFERLDRGETLTVFDTETTGLAWTTDRVLSFSALLRSDVLMHTAPACPGQTAQLLSDLHVRLHFYQHCCSTNLSRSVLFW